jgi:hypothetical protein
MPMGAAISSDAGGAEACGGGAEGPATGTACAIGIATAVGGGLAAQMWKGPLPLYLYLLRSPRLNTCVVWEPAAKT